MGIYAVLFKYVDNSTKNATQFYGLQLLEQKKQNKIILVFQITTKGRQNKGITEMFFIVILLFSIVATFSGC